MRNDFGGGFVFDGANAIYYLAEKDYSNAARSGLAMVPAVGEFVTGEKYLTRVPEGVDNVVRAVDEIQEAVQGTVEYSNDIVSVRRQTEGLILGGSGDGIEGGSASWLAKKNGEIDWKSTPNFGHTFSTHGEGEKNTKALLDRAKTPNAKGEYVSQGQWLNNQAAAEYLNEYGKIEYSNPPVEIPIPKGLAQVIHPDGTITEATKARIVINKKTGKIRSAIPINE